MGGSTQPRLPGTDDPSPEPAPGTHEASPEPAPGTHEASPEPAPGTRAVPPGTWGVRDLTESVRAVLVQAFGEDLWVEGEIANLSRSGGGHVYFTLVEPGEDGRSPEHCLAVTLFDFHRQRVNQHIRRSGASIRMADGVRVRIRGALDLYSARSTLQLRMTAIDPTFTLGALAADRGRVLASLAADRLIEANGRLPVPFLPSRIAVITSVGSAAHADVIHELDRCDLSFHLIVVDSRVQGAEGPPQLVSALGAAVAAGVEIVLIARGGGARTDLVAFDDERVARAVASCPVPVFVGIGHEIDRTVVDEVCHSSFKTPTASAAAIVALACAGRDRLEESWSRIGLAAVERLRTAEERHRRSGLRIVAACGGSLAAASASLDHRWHRVATAVGDRLRNADSDLARTRSVLSAADPKRTLSRGWTITRLADGSLARAGSVRIGDELVTYFADGTVHSTATDTVHSTATDTVHSTATDDPRDVSTEDER